MPQARLPIDDILPELCQALGRAAAVVLKAPTGAGKTTRVPPAVLHARLAGDRQVILLQPRRVAARAAADRIACERGWVLGQQVGYHVRLERRASPNTRILAVTDGVFVRWLQDDPFLERAGVVVFDEFHERRLDSDLGLAMVSRVQRELRPDLKIIVMSATLDPAPLAAYLGNCPIIESQGRSFPVDIRYSKFASSMPAPEQAARSVAEMLGESPGDLLVFLPGVREIRRTHQQLAACAAQHDLQVMELYGEMPLDQQQAVLEPCARRKVVLATNVAETSLTIEGITGVVDTGLARVLRRDPAHGVNRLEIERISRASADQRAGRAGRTARGVCQRLWTDREQQGLPERETPEIERVDLAGLVLGIAAWGEADWKSLPWFEPPPAAAIASAIRELHWLGALQDGRLTPLGGQMARLAVHPRLARLLIAGCQWRCTQRAALAAALLAERDPFLHPSTGQSGEPAPRARHSDSDLADRVLALEAWAASGQSARSHERLNAGQARWVLRAADRLRRSLADLPEATADADAQAAGMDEHERLLRAIAQAFSDRVGRRREPGSRRAALVGGRGVRLARESGLAEGELFAVVEMIDAGQPEALVRQASLVRREWLDPRWITATTEVEFDAARQRVVAWRRTRYLDLVIDEASTAVPTEFDAGQLLANQALATAGLWDLLNDEERSFIERVRSLADWMPELGLPHWSGPELEQLLPRLCQGCRSLEEVRKLPKLGLLKNWLAPAALAAVEREAPPRLQVPSGSYVRVEYRLGQPPVLAVRIQELFGLAETPRVASGRVPVVLHLLGPNYRPQQVTTDLASFWRTTYAEVRKELRRRYPKHAWPENPLTAPPQRRPGRGGPRAS